MHVLRITIHFLLPGGYSSRSRQSKPSLPGCQIRLYLRFIAYIVPFLRICVVQIFFQPSFGGGGVGPLGYYAYDEAPLHSMYRASMSVVCSLPFHKLDKQNV